MEVNRVLHEGSSEMAYIGEKLANARFDLAQARTSLKRIEAKIFLIIKRNNPKMPATVIEREVANSEEVNTQKEIVDRREHEYYLLDYEHKSKTEEINCAKKLASKDEAELRLGGSYGNTNINESV